MKVFDGLGRKNSGATNRTQRTPVNAFKMPSSSVVFLPIASPSFPKIGANAAVETDMASAVHVV